jgi:putative Mn2+ efflux pump MntP
MPRLTLSHFEAAFLFALFVSVVMGITTKKTQQERLNYGAYCFACFIVALFGIGWAMKLGHG